MEIVDIKHRRCFGGKGGQGKHRNPNRGRSCSRSEILFEQLELFSMSPNPGKPIKRRKER
jgi:hypothetical protein